MAKSKNEIIADIEDHFKGKDYNDCYVGITSDAKKRLFNDHNVSEGNGHWIYRRAHSDQDARDIEEEFIKRGMDGGDGGGDESSKFVYAYKKTTQTSP